MQTSSTPISLSTEAKLKDLDFREKVRLSGDLHYTWSMIDAFIKCPRMFYYLYIMRLRPIKKPTALSAGYAMSVGLEKYRETGNADEAAAELISAAKEDDSVLVGRKIDDPKRSIERLLEIFYGYCNTYPNEKDQIIRPEVRFEYPVEDPFFFGRIDAVYRTQDGSPAIMEDKTTSRLGDSYFLGMKDSFQVIWYMYVAHALGLFNLDGKPHMPKGIINAIYIHPTTLRYERDISIKSPQALLRAYDDMLRWIWKIEEAKEQNIFQRNLNQCHAYSGCDFLPLRDLVGSQYDRVLEGNYVVRPKKEETDGSAESNPEP